MSSFKQVVSKMKRVLESDPSSIEVTHKGILEVPSNKSFDELPLSHYKALVDKKGFAEIIRALNNLVRWNSDKHPSISNKAHSIIRELEKWHEGKK